MSDPTMLIDRGSPISTIKLAVLLLYVLLSFLLFFLVRDVEISQDYSNYSSWYQRAIEVNIVDNFLFLKDPGFFLLSNISSVLNGGVYLVVFTLVSISIMSKAFFLARFDADIIFTFIFLYICKFFFTLELTQFRAAAAIALAILSLFFYTEKKWLLSISALLISSSIHLSAILILFSIPIVFLVKQEKHERTIVLLFISLLFTAILFPIDLNNLTSLFIVGERLIPYSDGSYQVIELSLINFYFLIKIFLYSFFCAWFFFKKSTGSSDRNYYFLQLFFYLSCLGTLFFVAFRLNDAIALRTSEFYSIFDLLFFSFLAKTLSNEWISLFRLFLVFLSCIFLHSSLRLIN